MAKTTVPEIPVPEMIVVQAGKQQAKTELAAGT
jgi:hypothetical protein